MKHIQIAHIIVHALPGSEVGECFKEALEIATKEWRNVTLIHNHKKYQILVNELIASILEKKEI